MGGCVILSNNWHMCVSSGPIENDNDLGGHIIIGQEHRLMKMAERKLARGIWDTVWVFPPGSDSDLNAVHPGNLYWVGEVGDGGWISWIDLDE